MTHFDFILLLSAKGFIKLQVTLHRINSAIEFRLYSNASSCLEIQLHNTVRILCPWLSLSGLCSSFSKWLQLSLTPSGFQWIYIESACICVRYIFTRILERIVVFGNWQTEVVNQKSTFTLKVLILIHYQEFLLWFCNLAIIHNVQSESRSTTIRKK